MRKTKLTYDMVQTAIDLKSSGLNDCDIIDALGVHPSTFYRWLKDGEDARAGTLKRELCDGLDDMFISSGPGRPSRQT